MRVDKRTEFEVYSDYVGLKLHFNSWDFRWNSERKYNISQDALSNRADKSFFSKFVELKTKREDRIEFFISAFCLDRRYWIGDLFNEEIEDDHRTRMKRRRALEYNFRVDCENIQDHLKANEMTLPELLKIGNSQPRIFETRIDGGITEESMSILDYFFNFTKQKTENMLWDETRLKLSKYKFTLSLHDYVPKFKGHIDTLLKHRV